MKTVINILFTICLMAIVAFIYFKSDVIADFIVVFMDNKRTLYLPETNSYKRNYEYINFTNEEDYIPYSKEDIINIYYNVLNNGWKQFTFYCPKEYESCHDDVTLIANDKDLMSKISDYVNPFNSFTEMHTIISSAGDYSIVVTPKYDESKIAIVNNKINEIINGLDLNGKTIEEKISIIHNYLIGIIDYDKDAAEGKETPYDSTSSYGALIEGKAVCSGYSDTLSLFLDKLNIPNFKISSEHHSWNAIKLDDSWYHIDLTWDDVDNNKYRYNYYLIDTEELLEKDPREHAFDKTFYKEAV